MNREQLEAMNWPDLRSLASVTEGVELTPSDKKDTIITKILMQEVMVKETPTIEPEAPQDVVQPLPATPIAGVDINALKERLNPFILRGLKLYHNPVEHTWLMQIKLKPMLMRDTNTGETRYVDRIREDSGTMQQPIEMIHRCARVLMSNAPAPKEVEQVSDRTKGYDAVA